MMLSLIPLLEEYSRKTGLIFDASVKGDNVYLEKHCIGPANCSTLLRYYGRKNSLYGSSVLEMSAVDTWLSIVEQLSTVDNPDSLLGYANAQTATVTYLAGHSLSIADFAFWNYIQFHNVNLDRYTHLKRWYSFISSTINISSVLPKSSLNPQTGSPKKKVKQDDVGKFVDLPAAEMGKVVVRFPPEASGYLHIGHAKAALVNQYYQQLFQGKLILRFDDTNPAKENEHFENVIRKDLEMLEVKYDVETRSSDHFETLIKYCEQMIREGNAYADDTEGETMKQEREARIESKNRNNSVEKNLEIWNEMLIGSEKGQQYCIRAKIDMNSNNGCMRDPTLYRCKTESHVSTGDKFKAYPTYDFTCPIVDSIEGVTHALRTTEYNDRNEQYGWILDKLKLRKPHIWEYARLNLQNTVLSKRKLTWLVNEGVVDSWEDPRFPTVRGILRHGMTVQGLKDFIAAQGGSRSVVQMEWDKIWSFNKKVIDPVAPRYTALSQESLVPVELEGFDVEDMKEHQLHPKNKEVGMKQVAYSKTILIEQADALLLNEGESVTLINWGNCVINKLHRSADAKLIVGIDAKLNLSDTNFKSTKHKLTWLPEKHSKAQSVPITARYYDHLISKPVLGKDEDMKDFVNWNSLKEESLIGDHNMSKIKERDIIQIQRKGFFICDRAYQPFQPSLGRDLPAIFIFIPDGHKTQEEQVKQVAQTSKQKQNSPKKTKTTEPTTGDTGKGLDLDKVKKLTGDISAQGDLVRKLKSEKKPAEEIKSAVEQLLALKNDFKSATGVDYTPQAAEKLIASAPDPISNSSAVSSDNLDEQVAAQGEKVRALKAQKAPKEEIDSAVQELLALKAQFKQVTGNDWKPKTTPDSNSGASKSSSAAKEDKENAKGAKKSEKKKDKSQKEGERKGGAGGGNDGEGDGQKKKETKLGLGITMEENYSEWYTQVITKAEMIEYYDVSGCYVLRPLAYAIWEMIQKFFDAEIKKLDVENVYFPMFVSKAALEREKDHIADFAPEVAWVTRSGKSELAEPIAIRPTSETVMYPSYAKWIQSHRDLPLKLNQWNNVVRWEFKHPTPFLRTREFLWQEGHTAFATREEAVDEVHTILHLYSRVFQELLAIPVVKGRKTEKEKFPGADFTTTCEAFIFQCGRGIQGATSHHLGQNFSKMFNIVFENPDNPGEQLCVHQNCWGLSTRTIGTMVMMHSDNRGLVIPPRVAHFKAVVVPCGITDQVNEKQLHDHCSELTREFNESGLKAKADLRPNYSPGWKFNHWELKGVPVRVEIGPKDLQKEQVTLVRRDTGERSFAKRGDVISAVRDLLEKIHESLFEKAKNNLNTHMIVTKSFDEFCTLLDQKNILLAPFCGEKDCEGVIKEESAKGRDVDANAPSMGAKSLCIPFDQPKEDITKCKCINPTCKKAPKMFTLFGRSY